MAIKLKEMIQNELAPAFLKKGFTYDKAVSKPRIGLYIFSKGEPELSTEEQLQYLKHKIKKLPNREEIRIYCNRMKTDITVDLLSYLKNLDLLI